MTAVKNNPRPTTPYPLGSRTDVLTTSELLPGDFLWTASGVWEVESVKSAGHAGWRVVKFYGNPTTVSVVHTHPWIVAQQCSAETGGDPASGCESWAAEGSDYCFTHLD